MAPEQLWLTVLFEETGPLWPPRLEDCRVSLDESVTLQGSSYEKPFRTSPIFPLCADFIAPELDSCYLYFYCFDTAFPVLGRLLNVGSDELKRSLWYTIGLASILLITENPKLNGQVLEHSLPNSPRALEIWRVECGRITEISPRVGSPKPYDPETLKVPEYAGLPVAERAMVDELVSNLAFMVPKVATHIPNELDTFPRLVSQMSELIEELVYLFNPQGPPPATLEEYGEQLLQDNPALREIVKHQNMDRLIQVNSALSYVSTQMLSGAVPILERRSLIRRYSLLGVGSAILALNRITRSIEMAFSEFSIEDIISDRMADAKPLPGLKRLPEYDASEWKEYSIGHWEAKVEPRPWYPKLPYYSARLGFRETEYTITAALQCLMAGASTEWNLLTITHELLHGYVRNLLSLVFQGDAKRQDGENWATFYRCFEDLAFGRAEASNELESLRAVVLTYCCLAYRSGSLTQEGTAERRHSHTGSSGGVREITHDFAVLARETLWCQYEDECRNISEIIVHVLDLHYFYGSRLSAYIPLIWRSWAEVPHVGADLRQYILRSLLTISAKYHEPAYPRFNTSIARLDELLNAHIGGDLDVPLVHQAKEYLNDDDRREDLFSAFWASLILVDLADTVFLSHGVRGKLFSDPLAHWTQREMGFENDFEYQLPDGFCEEIVLKPAAYLLDRMLRRLETPQSPQNLEAETARLFLACCSRLDLD